MNGFFWKSAPQWQIYWKEVIPEFYYPFKPFIVKSSQQRCSIKKGVLRNFTKFIGKPLCQSLFFSKVTGLRHMGFPVNFVKFLRIPFLQNISGRLLLKLFLMWLFWKIPKQFLEVFCQKGVLKNFAKFTGNSPFNNAGLSPPTLLKKIPLHRCFPMKFAKFSRTPFLKEHLRWLLLKIVKRSWLHGISEA